MTNVRASIVLVSMSLVIAACRGQTSEEPPVVPIRNMYDQPRYDGQSHSDFFGDTRTMRNLVPGTIAREMEIDQDLSAGWREDGQGWVLEVPEAVIRRGGGREALVTRGQQRFGIYCAPCHGLSGHGDGPVARRAEALTAAALKPPTFHDDRIRHMPDGQMFATITNGVRNMPAYKHSIPVQDRWAVVTYVRALQLSQARVARAMPSQGQGQGQAQDQAMPSQGAAPGEGGSGMEGAQ